MAQRCSRRGGYLWTTIASAIFFGALTGSTALLILLVVFALVATAYALPTVAATHAATASPRVAPTRSALRL